MRTIKLEFRLGSGAARAAVCATLLVLLAGCGSLGLGWGSSDADADSRPSGVSATVENIVMGGVAQPVPTAQAQGGPVQTRFPSAVDKPSTEVDCPVLDVSPNGAALRDFGGSPEGTAETLHHQVSIDKLARECKDGGSNIITKLGVEGSVLLGPAGSPGTFSVPLVFQAMLNDKVVAEKRETLSVTIPPNDTRAFFSTVLTDFVIPKDDDVELYVGLGQGSGQATEARPHRRKRSRVSASR